MAIGYKQHQITLWKVRSWTVLIIGAIVLVGWSVFDRWQVEREMASRRAAIEAEYQALFKRYDTLAAEVAYLKDERSVETEIRKHFDVARAGESVVVLLDDTDESVIGTTTSSTSNVTIYPWWQFWR